MSQFTKDKITPAWMCKVVRVPGTGYVVTEWGEGDIKFSGRDNDEQLPRPKTLDIPDQVALDVLDRIEKDFPNANSSLIRIKYENRPYYIIGTVWAPPESNDVFLLKWYKEATVCSFASKKRRSVVVGFFFGVMMSLIAALAFAIWAQQNGHIVISWLNQDIPQLKSVIHEEEICKSFAHTQDYPLKEYVENLLKEYNNYEGQENQSPPPFEYALTELIRKNENFQLKKIFEQLSKLKNEYDRISQNHANQDNPSPKN